MNTQPLVSCIMPTYNRRRFVPQAIEYFLRQDYPEKELIILDDGNDSVADLIPVDPRIRYLRQEQKSTTGAKRNAACEEARGEIIVHWDDDDWMSPRRLSYQVRSLLEQQADICGLNQIKFYNAESSQAWEYIYQGSGRAWVYGATLCYTKSFWRQNPFPAIAIGEDTKFVWNSASAKVVALEDQDWIVCRVHPENVSPKQTNGSAWRPYTIEKIQSLMSADGECTVTAGNDRVATPQNQQCPLALVTAAAGIGDIIRTTPLIRVLHILGYQVDLFLSADYPETVELLRGVPEIRTIYHYSSSQGTRQLAELQNNYYDVATFTGWSIPFMKWVKSRQSQILPQTEWQYLSYIACIDKIARALGWQEALPEPFAMASNRKFDLAPGTIALHPGCKPDWPWKKWHGFEELARLLPHAVIIGSEADLDNSQTYFRKTFEWPDHTQNYVGKLSLPDTAALLKQCLALVSNDSGLMHLGVALGIPTFGIFGITSPQRELIPSRWMFPITKGLACEQACRQQPWGRRDCQQHLECLKTLTAEEVVKEIEAKLPSIQYRFLAQQKDTHMGSISLNYYGNVFDATGYGHAARGYIHALHTAGVKVSVINIGTQLQQVRDELVASLLGKDPDADFNLFHGIPPQWAHLAFPLRNVIAMTVWETDTMPQRWRNSLVNALDVWLPCNFNVEVFNRDLGRSTFRLPHPILSSAPDDEHYSPRELELLGLHDDDYLFYSIFEWQDRKCPGGMIKAFFEAFSEDGSPVLLLKTNPAALNAAQHTLDAMRAETGSQSRVILCCEAWTDSQLQMLHNRGDCYVSLHKGEGWGYPLFDAACRGKPVVATAYSGPLDFLDDEHHALVSYREVPVQQAYAYYHPGMRWAEPDINQAGNLMRRVYEQRDQVRTRAQEYAATLTSVYSLEAVGHAALNHLMTLLKHSNSGKRDALLRNKRESLVSPELPISGEWYDADYFENGLKSNWSQGYSWSLFKGLFNETAGYLIKMFPEAQSFLDVGCAKGFLVQALREKGMEAFGFDHSSWAITHAEPAVRDYLCLTSVDDVEYDRKFDVLIVFSLFETLTLTQIEGFLPRARSWTNQALIACIPTVPESATPYTPAHDQDMSHITMKTRGWWNARFIEAGWHQDALHRIVEGQCRAHPLPTRMGWEIYVYAP